MDDRTARLESAVERLQLTVSSLQQRIDALEAQWQSAAPATDLAAASIPASADAAPVAPAAGAKAARSKDPYDPIAMLSLVGRLLLVLAGGFLLRALTEAGYLADPVGIALAFAYAAAWLVMCDRAASRDGNAIPSAVFHALAAAMVAFPLILEATTRFKVLSAPAGALVLAAVTAAFLLVTWHRRLRAGLWIAVLGALPVAALLLIQTGVVVPYALVLIAIGVATLWLSYGTAWWGARWPAALAADAAVAAVTLRAFSPEHRDAPGVAVALQVVLLLGYLGTIAVRTLARRHDVSRFEIVQTALALAVGLGGGVVMARATGAVPAFVGMAAIALGAACYALALAVIARREGGPLNFYFYTTLALALVLAGFIIAVDARWAGALFALFAVIVTGLWARSGRLCGILHGAAYLLAAAIVSGALGYGAQALLTGVEGAWSGPDAVTTGVAVAAAVAAVLAAMRASPDDGGEVAIGTRFVIVLVATWTVCGCVIGFIAPLAGSLAGGLDTGVLATVRTGVLSVATLAIALAGRQVRYREWGWLVYPLLIGIGLKLVTQDFKHSRPATLFIALAFYGAALIIAPRLRRRSRTSAAVPST